MLMMLACELLVCEMAVPTLIVIPVYVQKNIPFVRAFAMQSGGRNCSAPLDLVLGKLLCPRVFCSGGVLCSRTPVLRDTNTILPPASRAPKAPRRGGPRVPPEIR